MHEHSLSIRQITVILLGGVAHQSCERTDAKTCTHNGMALWKTEGANPKARHTFTPFQVHGLALAQHLVFGRRCLFLRTHFFLSSPDRSQSTRKNG